MLNQGAPGTPAVILFPMGYVDLSQDPAAMRRTPMVPSPQSIAIESRQVKRGDELTLKLAAGGGQAIRFVAGKKP